MRPVNEARLKRTYDYIVDYIERKGEAPTFRQIQSDLNYVAVSSVREDIIKLKERGLLSNDREYKSVQLPEKNQISKYHGAKILGTVRCGEPIIAIEDIEATVALPDEIFGGGSHFILHAEGDSMINRGIFDGDLLVVEKRETADVGDIVVAIIGDEATTKILAKRKNGKLYLKAANDDHERYDIHPKDGFAILGVVKNTIHSIPGKDYVF